MREEELKIVLAEHKKWLEDKSQGKCADLKNQDLSNMRHLEIIDFSYAHLEGANLSGSVMPKAIFIGAFLNGTDFRCSQLQLANFDMAHLVNARFDGTSLEYASFVKACLEKANFSTASLRRANLHNVKADGAIFEFADLIEANLSNSRLENTRFMDSCLIDAYVYKSDLYMADLSKSNLEFANFYGSTLVRANLSYANTSNTDFREAILINTDLDSTMFFHCGGTNWRIDKETAIELAYHFCSMNCEDDEIIEAQNSLLKIANRFKRIGVGYDLLEAIPLNKNS
jgi:uncharacterized protein YjbI with pentapeptide repeats